MSSEPIDSVIRNIDRRLSKVEQILPALATRDELHAAIATAIAAAIAPLATREEVHAEGERARRHATVLFEDLRDDNRIILEHLLTLSTRVDELARR